MSAAGAALRWRDGALPHPAAGGYLFPTLKSAPSEYRRGVLCAVAAYTLWGLLPLYWRALHALPLGEVLAHRVLWSAATTLILLAFLGRLRELSAIARDARKRRLLLLSSLLIGANWSIYILAVYRG
jgi:chloramphenicol-sensitive protein RarD